MYIGVRVRDATVGVRARLSPREDINDDDQIGVFLDPYGDANSGFIFYFNALGIAQDIRYEGGGYEGWNFSWDTVVYSEGRPDEHGYDLEIGIPFRSLKYPDAVGDQTWGVIVTRKIPGDNESYGFPQLERNPPRRFTEAAPMTFAPPQRGSGIEIVPGLTLVQSGEYDDPTGRFVWSGVRPVGDAIRPSADVRWGLSPSVGVGATINPDFSQVENDETPIALNQRFAFSFDEQRPFFLDGSGYLTDIVGSLYSRSIHDPAYAVKAYSQSDKYSVGVLNAYDRNPFASFNQAPTPGFAYDCTPNPCDDADFAANADAISTVARVSRAVGAGGHAAVMLTDKDIVDGDGLRAWSKLGGVDISVPIGDWTISGVEQISATDSIRDDEPAMIGVNGGIDVAYVGDTDFEALLYGDTPGFRREVGFQTLSGQTGAYAELGHTFEPGGAIGTIRPYVLVDGVRERSGNLDVVAEVGQDANLGSGRLSAAVGYERIDVADVHVNGIYGSLEGGDAPSAAIAYRVGGGAGREYAWEEGVPATSGWGYAAITLRPSPGLRADVTWNGNVFVPDGYERDLSQRVRVRVNSQFSRTVGLRLIAEHVTFSDRDPQLISSALFTVLKQPGTAVYVGVAERTDLAAMHAVDRTVFAKATVLLRP